MSITVYKSPQAFLEANMATLMLDQLRNNLIFGNAINARDNGMIPIDFVAIGDVNNPDAISIRTSPKVIISSLNQNKSTLKKFWDYYAASGRQPSGVIGDESAAEVFASFHPGPVTAKRAVLVQRLHELNPQALAPGEFAPATAGSLEVLHAWACKFAADERLKPERSSEQMLTFIKMLIERGDLFVWSKDDQPVSMAAIIRRTPDVAVIGFVYTPLEERGKRYSASCVQELSRYILNSESRDCALLVYESNTRAREIYSRLGYHTVARFCDIDFE